MPEGTVVTFYSYKGGVGRTMALANIGALLTRWGYRVLCVDWDLEAPGLHLYFPREKWVNERPKPGLADLIASHVAGAQPDWKDFVTECKLPGDRSLHLMTAGLQDEEYVRRVQGLAWDRLYAEHNLGNFIESLREDWKKSFDFILVDSRTGITDTGGICTVQLPDLMVLLFTANMQSLTGSVDVIRRAREARQRLPFDRAKLLVLPVATRFEIRVEYELAQRWLKDFAEHLDSLYRDWLPAHTTPSELLNYTKIPYIPYWSFGERLPVVEKGTHDPEDIGFPLESLAALLAHRLGEANLLVESRESYVSDVARNVNGAEGPKRERRVVNVSIFHAREDLNWANRLHQLLRPVERKGTIRTSTKIGDPSYDTYKDVDDCDIAIVLVSPSFLTFDSVWDRLTAPLIARARSGQTLLIPVIVSPSLWKESDLRDFDAFPKDGAPLTDDSLVELALKIRNLADRIAAGA